MIDIFNFTGEKILATNFRQQTSGEIDLSGFPKGIYFVKVYDGEKMNTKKIVLQ